MLSQSFNYPHMYVTGNHGGDVAVRRRWDRQLSDVGQFRFVSGATACSSARERARIVQATLRVVASEVIHSARSSWNCPRERKLKGKGTSERRFINSYVSFVVVLLWLSLFSVSLHEYLFNVQQASEFHSGKARFCSSVKSFLHYVRKRP